MALIVVAHNITDLAAVSDYEYQVLVGDGTKERSHLITSGRIEGHVRADGWKKLIQRVLDESPTDTFAAAQSPKVNLG